MRSNASPQSEAEPRQRKHKFRPQPNVLQRRKRGQRPSKVTQTDVSPKNAGRPKQPKRRSRPRNFVLSEQVSGDEPPDYVTLETRWEGLQSWEIVRGFP